MRVIFNRWVSHDSTTWSHQIFSRYDAQLGMIGTAQNNAKKYVYKSLAKQGAQWTNSAAQALGTGDKFLEAFKDLEHWSENYNLFDNWVNLSRALTCAANLETYIAGVVDLAILSDPGILVGATKAVDGAALLKRSSKVDTSAYVTSCTKGDWSSRLASLERLFGALPSTVLQLHADLEELRNIRNRFGHAFGRDIAEARDHGARVFRPMETLKIERVYQLESVCRKTARELDRFLLDRHIGDFDAIRFLSRHTEVLKGKNLGDRAISLKSTIGGAGATPRGKQYCRDLVSYWEAL